MVYYGPKNVTIITHTDGLDVSKEELMFLWIVMATITCIFMCTYFKMIDRRRGNEPQRVIHHYQERQQLIR